MLVKILLLINILKKLVEGRRLASQYLSNYYLSNFLNN